jgi:hypothetical protein
MIAFGSSHRYGNQSFVTAGLLPDIRRQSDGKNLKKLMRDFRACRIGGMAPQNARRIPPHNKEFRPLLVTK